MNVFMNAGVVWSGSALYLCCPLSLLTLSINMIASRYRFVDQHTWYDVGRIEPGQERCLRGSRVCGWKVLSLFDGRAEWPDRWCTVGIFVFVLTNQPPPGRSEKHATLLSTPTTSHSFFLNAQPRQPFHSAPTSVYHHNSLSLNA